MIRSLRARFWVALLLPGLLLTLAGGLAYLAVSRLMVDELGESLSRIAATTASQLSAAQLTALEPGDERIPTRTFQHLARQLEDVRTASGARRIYAVDADGRVFVDTDRLPIGAQLPDLALDRLELTRVRAGGRAWSKFPFVGADGTPYERGYAPLRAEGKVFGAVGVEASAGFFAPLHRLSRRGLWLGALTLSGLALLASTLARALTRPLTRLVASAERIGEGDLATPIAPERTLEIGALARELEAMRRALEARDRQLSMMLAGVAHEVRNPIGGIQLFAGLLAEELSSNPAERPPSLDEARAHVARISSELGYLDRVVGDFLAFAREQRLSFAPVEMDRLLETARQMMASHAKERGVTVSLTAAPCTVEADADLLLAAVVNLVKNAIQAAPEGGTVQLTGERTEPGYRAAVVDRGPGVQEANPERIFEPFFTTREQGTGLGLPLARKIVQAHRGALTYQRREGETRFEIALPLRQAEGRAGILTAPPRQEIS